MSQALSALIYYPIGENSTSKLTIALVLLDLGLAVSPQAAGCLGSNRFPFDP
jgi:hypothetical protein